MRALALTVLFLPVLALSGCCFTFPDEGGAFLAANPAGPRAASLSEVRVRPGLEPLPTTVRVEVFVDFQCPYCRKLHPDLVRLRQTFGAGIDVALRMNPLPFHDKAAPAARAALAAGRQGKLWEMSSLLYEVPANLAPEQAPALAARLGLDVERFRRDVGDPSLTAEIERDQRTAAALGARGTPTTFVNGRKIVGAKPYEQLEPIVREEVDRVAALRSLSPR